MSSLSVSLRLLALVSVAGLSAADAPEPKMDPAGLEFFEKNIRPILTERCYECHSKEKGVSKGGLIMDSRQGMLAGGIEMSGSAWWTATTISDFLRSPGTTAGPRSPPASMP